MERRFMYVGPTKSSFLFFSFLFYYMNDYGNVYIHDLVLTTIFIFLFYF